MILVFFICLLSTLNLFSDGLPFLSDYHAKIEEDTKTVREFLSAHDTVLIKNDLIPEAIFALEYLHVYSPFAKEIEGSDTFLKKVLQLSNTIKDTYIITALEVAYSAFPVEFREEITTISKKTFNKRILSLTYLYLKRVSRIPKNLLEKINKYSSDSLIQATLQYHPTHTDGLPPIEDLLALTLEREEWILYILRSGENGKLFIKDSRGEFIRKNDKIYSLPVYARSVTTLPSFFPMGDTPSGIYRILGITTSSNPRIGPVPVIQLGLPFEISVNTFFPGLDSNWTKEVYSRFLPESWKSVSQIYNTYQAGMNGRTSIWIHGATLDPKKFLNLRNELLFTPTFGCISLPEKWEKGNLLESKQWDLVSIWLGEGKILSGYAILVDVPSVESDFLEKAFSKIKKPQKKGL